MSYVVIELISSCMYFDMSHTSQVTINSSWENVRGMGHDKHQEFIIIIRLDNIEVQDQ